MAGIGDRTTTVEVRPGAGDRLAVVGGGAIGTLLRAALAGALGGPDAALPWGTLAANLVGALLLGLLVGAAETGRGSAGRVIAGAGTGLLGAFTTFGALSVETLELAGRDLVLGGAYLAASVVAGLGLAWLGRRSGARLAAGGPA